MKSILLSMRPDRCEKVVDGSITIDVRKTRVNIQVPFKVYLYCTKPRRVKSEVVRVGHVVGEFICRRLLYFPLREISSPLPWQVNLNSSYYITSEQLDKTGMSYNDLCRYGKEKDLYGLEISDFELYDIPKPLSEFCYASAPEFNDVCDELCKYCYPTEYGEHKEVHTPSGVYMCEGKYCSEAYEALLEEEYMILHPPRSFCRVKMI